MYTFKQLLDRENYFSVYSSFSIWRNFRVENIRLEGKAYTLFVVEGVEFYLSPNLKDTFVLVEDKRTQKSIELILHGKYLE